MKVLVDSDSFGQRIVEIHDSGKILSGTVLWDERIDGPLKIDESKIGAYKKVGSDLIEDNQKLVWHNDIRDKIKDREDKVKQKKQFKDQLVKDFKDRLKNNTELTDAEIKLFMKKIMELYV